MKKQFLILSLFFFSLGAGAQSFAEWFQQGATQKKYLVQQIAALQLYIGYVQEGYTIAKKGLGAINDIKHAELSLHTEYFNSLKTVNPTVRNYAKVGEVIAMQLRIVQLYKKALKQIKNCGDFNEKEILYMKGVFDRLIDDCTKTLDELIAVTTNGRIEMSDDERLTRVESLYRDMQSKYTFVQGFSNEAKMLASSRSSDQDDIQTSRAINGIK
ncbi:MAG: hypothetical protein ABI688_06910 [Bacteroidota bacterium]